MEMIGKGKEKGAVWVASKVPDGFMCAHANQARTRTFDLGDPENVLYSGDVITFAQDKGYYPVGSKAEDFDFSAVYDAPTFTSVRLGEARVWNIYNKGSSEDMNEYLEYAQGQNLSKRMPLFVKPKAKLSVNDTMELMRSHGEGTWFDNSGTLRADVGSESGNSMYRWRPLVWEVGDQKYVNERTVGTQQTAWNFVAESRSRMPDPLKALMWWAPDDSATALRIPVYGGITKIPPSFGDRYGQDPNSAVSYGVDGDAYTMSMDSAFWIWNLVANMAYGERAQEVYPLVQQRIHTLQDRLFAEVQACDLAASKQFSKDPAGAVNFISNFAQQTGEQATKDWRNFWMYLFARFRDGFSVEAPSRPICTGGQTSNCTGRPIPETKETGYSEEWYKRVVEDGDNAVHYAVPKSSSRADQAHEDFKLAVMDKRQRRRRQPRNH